MPHLAAGLALFLAATGGAGCRANGERPEAPSALRSAPLPREFQLAPGQAARADGLTVRFDGVPADSRCPLGVQCVWEGDAVVDLTVSEPSREGAALELHTAGRFPREGTYGRYRVRLMALEPQPREGEPVRADRYRATLVVSVE